MYFLAGPLAFLIRPIYNLTENYGITLIIATIIIKILTIPLTLKSQKNMAKTQLIQPEMNKLQAKYKNDKDKLAMEMQKLYKEYDVNPMGGCLPLIIQMFILFGFIGVIYHPFEHILGLSGEEIKTLAVKLGMSGKTNEMYLWGAKGINEALNEVKAGLTNINFNFFGINLTKAPNTAPKEWTVWIFPALATASTVLSSYMTKKQQPQPAANQNSDVPNTGDTMLKIMPFMTAFFTYSMPIGMSLYWTVSTVVQLIQQSVMNKFVNDKMKLQIEEKQDEIREKKEKRHHKKH